MSEQDDIDIRRALVLAKYDSRCGCVSAKDRTDCIGTGICACLFRARDIRASDEAAGYITAKLEGVVNEKDRRL